MRALVSGQAGVAILVDGDRVSSLHFDSPQPVSRRLADIPHLLADASDVIQLPKTTAEEAAAALDLCWHRDRALHLALILLDREADRSARQMSAECLEEFISDPRVLAFVLDRLYSTPLPDSADMVGALLLSEAVGTTKLNELFENLGEFQPEIRRRRSEWDALPFELFGSPQAKLEFGYVAVTSGTFRGLVQSDPERVNNVLVGALADARFGCLGKFRKILMSWIKPVHGERKTLRFSEKEEQDEPGYARRREAHQAAKPRRSHVVFENVNRQKEAIKQAISGGRRDRVAKYVDDLVAYQLERSEREEGAKSLCDLAMHAKSVGAHDLQLELAHRATETLPTDGWSQAQLGDAYLCLGRFDEAFAAYRAAGDFGCVEIARNGRAEVLKALGRLDEALQEYEAAVRDFPDSVVARNGRAEVLKALDRLDEALQEYEAAVHDFPSDVVARTGRAEVLKALGRLDEALQEYEATVRDFPHDVFARTGRAEVLKALGRFDEALQEYEASVRDFPYNVVARTGRAEVLKALGRLDEALREYDATVRDFPSDVVARTGRAEVLKALGRLDEALQEYEAAVCDFPHNMVARNGRAEVLKALGRYDEALREYERTLIQSPGATYARNGKASILVLLGAYENALQILPDQPPKTLPDWVAYHVRGMIALKRGDVPSAIQVFERGARESPWHATRGYFRGALALARLRRSEFSAAAQALADEHAPVAEVLRIHAFGGLGDTANAERALRRIATNRLPTLELVRDELAARFVMRTKPHHSDEWVFDREWELLLAA